MAISKIAKARESVSARPRTSVTHMTGEGQDLLARIETFEKRNAVHGTADDYIVALDASLGWAGRGAHE